MKPVYALFLIVMTCAGVQAQQDILPVLLKMEQAMESGSYRKMLKLTDGAYREEQLENMLQGNLQQFIDELISGYSQPDQTGAYLSVKLSDIDKVSLCSVTDKSPGKEVVFRMQLSDGRIVWTVMLFVEDPETRKWGAVGAYG